MLNKEGNLKTSLLLLYTVVRSRCKQKERTVCLPRPPVKFAAFFYFFPVLPPSREEGGVFKMVAIELTDQLMQSFKIAKVFRDNSQHVTSLDFDPMGEYCITASSDDTLNLYDSVVGKHTQTIPSKKYGATLARFAMHRPGQVIYASNKGDDTLRLLSLQEKTYLRYFRGHQQRVVALEASPLNEQFLSAATNDTIRLWDLRSSTCQAQNLF